MSQSKRQSVIETCSNTSVGFVGSYLITFGCFHLSSNLPTATLYATLGCTVWSLLRGYYLRRLFNKLHAVTLATEGEPEPEHLFPKPEPARAEKRHSDPTACDCGANTQCTFCPKALENSAT